MGVKRYKGQPLPIVVSFTSDPLVVYGKTYGDITAIAMNLKKDLATDADTTYLQKTLAGGGVAVDSVNHKFTMQLAPADYANLNAGESYYLTLNVQVPGISEYIELNIPDREVRITSDTNRA